MRLAIAFVRGSILFSVTVAFQDILGQQNHATTDQTPTYASSIALPVAPLVWGDVSVAQLIQL